MNPLSFNAWIQAVREGGLLAFALIFLLAGTFSFQQNAYVASESLSVGLGNAQFLRGIFLSMAFFCSLPAILTFRWQRLNIGRWLFAYVLFYLASSLWSQNQLMTLGKGLELFIGLWIFMAAASMDQPLKKLDAMLSLVLLILFAVLTYSLVGFLLGLDGFWINGGNMLSTHTLNTDFMSANSFGYYSATLLLILIFKLLNRQISTHLSILLGLGLLAVLIFSTSRTGLAILVFGTLYLLFIERRALFYVGVTALTLGGMAFWELITEFFLEGHNIEFFLTLSGRTVMWTAALEMFWQSPWWGMGAGVGTKAVLAQLEMFKDAAISSAHNGFIEVLNGTGLIGFFLFIVPFITVAVIVFQSVKSSETIRPIALLYLAVIATTIMSIGAGGWMTPVTAIFFASAGIVDAIRNHRGAPSEADIVTS